MEKSGEVPDFLQLGRGSGKHRERILIYTIDVDLQYCFSFWCTEQ